MARYHEIAADLRARIKAGEWAVGEKLPGISALQEHYEVEKSLGTIRRAQQLLVADGMLRTEQGVGAFVIATEPVRVVTDLAATLTEAQGLLADALAAVHRKGNVTFDLSDDDRFYVLDQALREFAERARFDAQEETVDNTDSHRRWAEIAEQMRAEIDAALG